MNQIQIRHYRVEGLACTPWAETLKTLNRKVSCRILKKA